MGEYDLVRPVVERLGELDFWKVAMRPGKPLAVGRIGNRPFVGLPGNPVSSLVGVEVFVLPLVLAMSGKPGWARPRVAAELGAAVAAPPGLRTFVRARLSARAGAAPLALPATGQGSHQLRSLAASNCLLDIPEDAGELAPGALVTALLVDQPPAPRL
jgi:molybdopterin molybdotransferase